MYSASVLFTLVVTATTVQLVYPEESPVTSKQIKDDRKPFYSPGLCPENQMFYAGDQVKDWVCDCAPRFIYYPPTDKCYHVYKQGPCKSNEYLILKKPDIPECVYKQGPCKANEYLILKKPDIPECVQNPCTNDTLVPFEGKCLKLHSTNGCPPAHLGGGTLQVNETSLQLECVPSNDLDFIIQIPSANCPAGSKRSAAGRCRNQF